MSYLLHAHRRRSSHRVHLVEFQRRSSVGTSSQDKAAIDQSFCGSSVTILTCETPLNTGILHGATPSAHYTLH